MELNPLNDTICAIATPRGEGGIGIIKISGPASGAITRSLFVPSKKTERLISHHLSHGAIIDPDTGDHIDEVLLAYMAAPRTYTREDVVEINCHGGFAAVDSVLSLVMKAGARLAEPGEFTRRAFLNGRIDLSQAEAVAEVIQARSRGELQFAERQLRGGLRNALTPVREALLDLHAHIEAELDFAEDLDSDDTRANEELDSGNSFLRRLEEQVALPLRRLLENFNSGRVLREGLGIVLAGKPNVGKSSLLNGLLGRDRAIVTPTPGTTRDVVEDSFTLSGVRVRILDTAGIRHLPDEIEAKGIERTLCSIADADVVLCVMDQSCPPTSEDDTVYRTIRDKPHVLVFNKSDLPRGFPTEVARERFGSESRVLSMSALAPADVDRLKQFLSETFLESPLEGCRSSIIPNLRQSACIARALESLQLAREALESLNAGEIAGLELTTARRHIDSVLGLDGDGDLLDRVFSRFCIGK